MAKPEQAIIDDPNLLSIRYIPLSQCILWEKNPKMHDIGSLSEAIKDYGFCDAPKWDGALNNGNGGIVEGNGRIETLNMMYNQGMDCPRGIAKLPDGSWAVPITFGVDAESQLQAERYAIDHNNLTMLGGDFTVFDLSRMWQSDSYNNLLAEMAEKGALPVTISEEDFEDMQKALSQDDEDELSLNDEFGALDLGDPREVCQIGDRYIIDGQHILIVASPVNHVNLWLPHLTEQMTFIPYAGLLSSKLLHTNVKDSQKTLFLLQPDWFVAGHIIDKLREWHGTGYVVKETV